MSEPISSKATAVDYDPFAATLVARVVPTTDAQRELWLADKLGREASLSFNESVTLSIEGELSLESLQSALLELSNRHEALRSVISDDGLSLLIAPQGELQASLVDLHTGNAEAQAVSLARLRTQLVETQFDLVNGPLINAVLVKLGARKHELFVTGHHIVCDGWSFGVLAREVMAHYQAMQSGVGAQVLPPANSFGDFALALLDPAHVQAAEADSRYWVSQFDSSVPVLDLPTDRMRPTRRTFNSRREEVVVEPAIVDAMRKLGAKNGASLHATLFSVFSALMARLGNTDEVVVGVPAAAQAAEGTESLIGHGVNLLPVRVGVDVEQDFASFLKRARTIVLDAYDHQSATFGSVLQKLKLDRDPSRLPLVAVQFNLDSAIPPESLSLSGLQVSLRSVPRHFENFELFLNASQIDGGLVLETQYNTDLFDATTVRRWLGLYRLALQRAAANSAASLADLFAPTPEDLELVARFNDTGIAYSADLRVEAMIGKQALATPDAIAVVSGEVQLTYRELDERANALAAQLRARGVERGSLVGLYCGRSEAMVVGLLGILKSGAGYIPLDPSFPSDRLEFMVSDSGLRHIVTDSLGKDGAWEFTHVERVEIDATRAVAAPSFAGSASDVAYVLYTSGSTGKPKGVQVEHRNVVNFLESMRREPGLAADDVLLAVTTLSFDIAGLEIWLPLTLGARILIATREDALDGQRLVSLIDRHRVTMLQATPTTWRLLLEAGWQGRAQLKALCGGEALPRDLAATLIGRVGELWNMYGPTETTIWSTLHRVRRADGIMSIGHPIANTQVYVLDAKLRELPVGVAGEIFIAGEGVTRGYLERPELTAEKFLTDPHAKNGARWYRTGDLGRWRADGLLECLGRSDHQIKLRGYRIELGEIETCLAQHASVERTVVITREDQPGDVRLVAYLVPKGSAPAADDLRDHLRRSLPEYMIPQHFVEMAVIPLLPNGKINRKALPKPETSAAAPSEKRVAASTPLEAQVLESIEQVLNLPGLGVTDNFFALGGHSLLAARLAAKLASLTGVRIPLATIFEAPTARALAAWLEAKAHGPGKSANFDRWKISRRSDRYSAPASSMQHRLWFLEQTNPGRSLFNTPSAHRLRGVFDAKAFDQAFSELIRRQDSLRTVFEEANGEPVQVILPELDYSLLPIVDLSDLAPERRESELMSHMCALAAEPLELAEAPLFRARLFRLAAEEHVFYFSPHHIIWDGWSFDILYDEMALLYDAYRSGATPQLAELPFNYGDFASWHRDWLKGAEVAEQLAHWKQSLSDLGEPLAIPTDKPRPAEMTGNGDSTWLHLPASLCETASKLARDSNATPFVVYLAAYAMTLSQLTSQRDIVVGIPVRGRHLPELERLIGLFVNALPIRLRIEPKATFAQLIESVRDRVVDAFKHPDVPFEALVRELHLPRDRSRFPLHQALFSHQDARGRPHSWGNLSHEQIHVMQPGVAEDLSLWLMERDEGLVGGLAFNTDILLKSSAERIRERFSHNLSHAVAQPQTVIDSMPLPQAELRAMDQWNATSMATPGSSLVHQRVMWSAASKVAISYGGKSTTYAELDARSNRLARALRERGARQGRLVGLCLEREPDMLCALLAVLKSGAGYVPIDPAFPVDRIRYMIDDARLAVLVTQQAHVELLGGESAAMLLLDRHADQIAALSDTALPVDDGAASGEDCAYVIYTSGTTGKPKGVMVPHRAVANFLDTMAREPGIGADDRLTAVTTLSFDIAVLELLLPLTVGARVVLASRDEAADARALMELLASSGTTIMQATPGTWRMLLDSGWTAPAGFKALVGGEALPPDLAARLVPVVGELWNMYGPTETTVWSTCTRVSDLSNGVSIGRPIGNTQIYILDEKLRQCPIGVAGEICIGGDGVTLGYLNRPELTAERFVRDEFSASPGARLYRTGDRGRWRNDGQLEHLGRNDFQVKIRGYRIELGEIEATLANHPSVAQAIAIAREDVPGDVRLVAYVVSRAGEVNAATLRDHLSGFLPGYMLPQFIVPIETVPLLPNGKIDRKALPVPNANVDRAATSGRRMPGTESEKLVAGIWSRLLGTSDIDVQDNFFDIGGHSLLAMQAMLELETATGKRIDRSRFVYESLRQVAAAYDQAAPTPKESPAGLRRLIGGVFGRKKSS